MQPTRIRNAAMRVLRRSPSRALDLRELARILGEEERITISPDALAVTLHGTDELVLLEPADPFGALPLVVHEAAPAYHEALAAPRRCYAIVDAQERPWTPTASAFDALAAPLLQVWRDAAGDASLRRDIADALGGLYTLRPAIDDAQARTR